MEDLKYKSLLAKKIIELGYKKTFTDYEKFTNYYVKEYEGVKQVIKLDSTYELFLTNYYVMFNKNITSQKDLDNMQIAFNRLQSDIKVLYGTDADYIF